MDKLPQEIYDAIVKIVERRWGHWGYWGYDDMTMISPRDAPEHNTFRQLAPLRLVNKKFNRSATLRMFHTIYTTLYGGPRPRNYVTTPQRLLKISESSINSIVRSIHLDVSKPRLRCIHTGYEPMEQFCKDLSDILAVALPRFANLRTLKIRGPSDYFRYPDQLRKDFTNAISDVFRHVSFENLDELNITLPLTHDFARLARRHSPRRAPFSITSLLQTLKYLSIRITHEKGWFLPWANSPGYYLDGPGKYPNEAYQRQFFKMVESTRALEYLKIWSTRLLDLDALDTTHLTKLRGLFICRFRVSQSKLLSLLQQNEKTLKALSLWAIELKSGTWAAIFLQLCKLPRLTTFPLGHARYWCDGESSQCRPRSRRLRASDLESAHLADKYALGELQRKINANRKQFGMALYSMDPVHCRHGMFKRLEEKPLDEVLSERQTREMIAGTRLILIE